MAAAAASIGSSAAPVVGAAHQRTPLTPPFRFAMVEEGLYRSAQPTPLNYPFLRRLRLRSILSLTKNPDARLEAFAAKYDITLKTLKVKRALESITLTHEHVAESVAFIINAGNLPLLVHCYDGADNTGLLIMCLRKLQHVALASSIAEYSRFKRPDTEAFSHDEQHFVDTFRMEIRVTPQQIPPWLWQGKRDVHHPTIPLQLPGVKRPQKKKGPAEDAVEKVQPPMSREIAALALAGLDY